MFRFENMTEVEVLSHLMHSREDFPHRNTEFIQEYAMKLSRHAKFVTSRSCDKSIEGIVAFYANQRPNAYITHIWVEKCLRGGVFVAKCYSSSMKNCNRRNSRPSAWKCGLTMSQQ